MARTLRLALRCIGLGLLAGLCPAAVAGSPAGEAAATLYVQARALEHGEGVARDPAQAIALYCAAVRQGNAEAMHALGWMYANGRAVERNDSLASTLFAMAAFSGHTHASTMLAHVGPHRGEVPDCLLASAQAGRRALATATAPEWNLAAYIAAQPPSRRAMVELVARLAPQYAIDPRLALAVAATESGLDPQARSTKNALGLMQLIPETAERFNVRDVFDPAQNVKGGLAYLRWLLAHFRGNVAWALAGYNAGEGAVLRFRGIPPYRETRDYVERIRALYPAAEHPYDARIAAASPLAAAQPRLVQGGALR